jgi:hypothetical protein
MGAFGGLVRVFRGVRCVVKRERVSERKREGR